MQTTNQKIGHRMRALRVNKGYTQTTAANILGISQEQYSRLESGESTSNALQLTLLRAFYKCTFDDLLAV